MTFLFGVVLSLATAYNIHKGWYGWAAYFGFASLYYMVKAALIDGVKALLAPFSIDTNIIKIPVTKANEDE